VREPLQQLWRRLRRARNQRRRRTELDARLLTHARTATAELDLAAAALGSLYRAHPDELQALEIASQRAIVVLAPHQDDEAIGAGGTLLLARRAGVPVHVVYLTDGAQPHQYSLSESARIRHDEGMAACRLLGADMHELGITNADIDARQEHLDALAEILSRVAPSVVMLPWLLDWPTRHRMANHLLVLAGQVRNLPSFDVWGYQVHSAIPANGVVEVSAVATEREQLLQVYGSQNAYYKRYDQIAMGMSAWNSRLLQPVLGQSACRHAELFHVLPGDVHAALVAACYQPDLARTYRGDIHVLPAMAALHSRVTTPNR